MPASCRFPTRAPRLGPHGPKSIRSTRFAPIAHHVVAHAVRSKRNGAPQSQNARWKTSLHLPAAVVRFVRASRGSDPIQPASQSVLLERPLQALAKSLSLKEFVSCPIRTGGKMAPVDVGDAASGCASTFEPRVSCCSMPNAARRASGTGGDLKPRGLAGNTVSAVPYRAPRTSARHTRDAGRRPRPPDPGFRRVRRHRNDRLLRYMQRVRDRTKHSAANKRCPDDSQHFHESFPSLQYGSQFTLIWNNASNIEHQAESNLANLDPYQRWIVVRLVFPGQI